MRTIYQTIMDLTTLWRLPYTNSQKIQITITFFRLLWLKIIRSNNIPITTKVLNYKVTSFNSKTLLFLFREIFTHGEYIFTANNEQPSIIDGGANIGFATLFFKWLYPKSTVYAFEPDPETFALLKKNIETNDLSGIKLYNSALCTHNNGLDFYIDPKQKGLLKMSTSKDRKAKKKIRVQSTDLAKWLENKKIDFLKLDIEGDEEKLITHLSHEKRLRSIPHMTIEYHHNIKNIPSRLSVILSILEKNGYSYRIQAPGIRVAQKELFQDILIYNYQN